MRAIVITRPGGPEVLEEQQRDRPEPGPSEIRVRVHASALNRADVLQRLGRYPAPAGYPADISGLEYAGEVDAIGTGAGLWAIGNRVMGITGGGGHSEYVVVHEREAIRIPYNLSYEEAAAIPEAFLTAFDALFHQLELSMGERLLIHAIGSGVGTAAVQLAHAAGISVIGTSRTPEKLRRVKELGMELGIDSSSADWAPAVEEATQQAGVHAVLDLVGGRYLEQNLRVLTTDGRIVVIGMMGGAKAELNLALLLRKRVRLMGSVLRSRPLEEKIALAREFSNGVIPLFSAGRIKPIIECVMPFSEIADAHRFMESNETFGKIVLKWE